MNKLYISESEVNETFHCSIYLAEDEDAFQANEIVVLGEANWCKSPKDAFVIAYRLSLNLLHIWQDTLIKKKIIYDEEKP